MKLAAFPFIVQMPTFVVLNVTGKPELADALNVTVPPTLWKPVTGGNEIVCVPMPTLIVAVNV